MHPHLVRPRGVDEVELPLVGEGDPILLILVPEAAAQALPGGDLHRRGAQMRQVHLAHRLRGSAAVPAAGRDGVEEHRQAAGVQELGVLRTSRSISQTRVSESRERGKRGWKWWRPPLST